jgi:hypothetical protein
MKMAKNKDFTESEVSRAIARKNLRVGNLTKETVKSLRETKMDERHAALNVSVQE